MEYYAYASGDVEAMIAAMLVMLAVCGIFMLAYYILAAISYYNVAKIRKMENPWLAWIPVVNSFLVGKVADDINKDYHKTTHRGVTLLVLNLISALSTVIILAVTFPLVFDLIDSAVYYGSSLPDQIVYDFLGKLMMVFIVVLLLMVVGIWEMVLRYMSQYTVFKEYAPQSAGVYLAISLVCQFVAGITFLPYIFILVIYKKTPQFQVLNAATITTPMATILEAQDSSMAATTTNLEPPTADRTLAPISSLAPRIHRVPIRTVTIRIRLNRRHPLSPIPRHRPASLPKIKKAATRRTTSSNQLDCSGACTLLYRPPASQRMKRSFFPNSRFLRLFVF